MFYFDQRWFTGKPRSMLWLCFLLYTNTCCCCCFLELILLFLKTCSVFLTPIADFPQVFQQVSQVPGSLLQMLKTHWETSLYVLGNQPCPTPYSATIKVSYVGVPHSQIQCLPLSSFTTSFLEAPIPGTCCQEKVRGNSVL